MRAYNTLLMVLASLIIVYTVYIYNNYQFETFKNPFKLYYVPTVYDDTIRFEMKDNMMEILPIKKKNTLTTNIDNMKDVLGPKTKSINIDYMAMLVSFLEEGKPVPKKWRGTNICINYVDLVRVRNGNRGTYNRLRVEGYFVRLIHPERINEMRCPYDISGRNIGVFDRCDYHLVVSIANGYRLPYTDYEYKIDYIEPEKWKSLEDLLYKEYDVMYAYIIPNSNFEKIITSQRIYISGFDTMDITRINTFYPEISMSSVYMEDMYKWDAIVKPNAVYKTKISTNLLWVSHYIFTINDTKIKIDPKGLKTETFVSRLDISDEVSNPSFRCYGDITNDNRALCNSEYDAWGNPKEKRTYWDMPCVEDKDCSFYQANKNYPNDFGKCLSKGICEFPVGINRLSYTKYKTEFPYTPMCYGCEPGILDCCKDQLENPERYPELESPDYVFPNDTNARESRNLETIIPMLL